jgi:hypothetical protein
VSDRLSGPPETLPAPQQAAPRRVERVAYWSSSGGRRSPSKCRPTTSAGLRSRAAGARLPRGCAPRRTPGRARDRGPAACRPAATGDAVSARRRIPAPCAPSLPIARRARRRCPPPEDPASRELVRRRGRSLSRERATRSPRRRPRSRGSPSAVRLTMGTRAGVLRRGALRAARARPGGSDVGGRATASRPRSRSQATWAAQSIPGRPGSRRPLDRHRRSRHGAGEAAGRPVTSPGGPEDRRYPSGSARRGRASSRPPSRTMRAPPASVAARTHVMRCRLARTCCRSAHEPARAAQRGSSRRLRRCPPALRP